MRTLRQGSRSGQAMWRITQAAVAGLALVLLAASIVTGQGQAWLRWTASQAEGAGRATYVKGRVGGFFDTRFLKTERSYNYKLAATWLTPDVIRASARLEQIHKRLSESAAIDLVEQAEKIAHTVVIVEIDPREGAGVVPLDWTAFLRFDGGAETPGTMLPELRTMPGLAGVTRRNYDYERFWVAFPLAGSDGTPIVPERAAKATLVVRIYDQEGQVDWVVPASIRERSRQLAGSRAAQAASTPP